METNGMKRHVTWIPLVLLLAVSAPSAQPAQPFGGMAPALQTFVNKGEIAGAVTLIATKDRVIHLQAVGRSSQGSHLGRGPERTGQ
jgi:hypothetical protein